MNHLVVNVGFKKKKKKQARYVCSVYAEASTAVHWLRALLPACHLQFAASPLPCSSAIGASVLSDSSNLSLVSPGWRFQRLGSHMLW